MDNQILFLFKILNFNVSRETVMSLKAISMIQEKYEINLISREIYEKEQIRERHIIDSAQIVDFVDLNYNTTDLGTGGGMPGLIIAIVMKIKNDMKINYMKKVITSVLFKRGLKKLNLNTDNQRYLSLKI